MFKRFNAWFLMAVAMALACLPAWAADTYADSSAITATASTAFVAVSTLVVAIVGFYIVLKIVRGIKGR